MKIPVSALCAGFSISLMLLSGCSRSEQKATPGGASPAVAPPDARKEFDEWRLVREQRLRNPEGWLTLVGLFWLKPGENPFGSASSNPIVLPASAPAVAGSFVLENGVVTMKPAKGGGLLVDDNPPAGAVVVRSDSDGEPTMLRIGSVNFFVIRRGDKVGVRVRDSGSELLKQFKGLDYFPFDPKWRVVAKFEPYNPPRMIPILNVLGQVEDMPSPGALVFTVDGQQHRLDPVLEPGESDLFVIYGDATNGKQTYGAGRYLYARPADAAGNVVLDFNRSYNPPCAFTRFATCPLPPLQNRLKARVEAGEKTFEGAH